MGGAAAVELALKKGDLVTVTEDDVSVLLLKSTDGEGNGETGGGEGTDLEREALKHISMSFCIPVRF